MPILFQSRNIRHLLGMYFTKQAEQEIYLIAQPPPPPPLAIGALSNLRGGAS